ncbi:LysR family transcriptional regulator [Streptomyces triticirhizae]|uniref:LysR family transcriptional regulator n=1 Tax=Streptomyces triticirhizae TaxID=2483353 RepID=A0A3M2LV43_9ACTN|nr:LysR family transcriptional regulator [Streptomyces triticirhizae]RMI41227.1 LysR family transcriptional regulator [Streptomyces triticirhizae]
MLNIDRLRVLHAVRNHGSVSGAALALRVTTSAVSQQLAKLERETGQRLLARNGRGIRLTDAGRLLADHAERILGQVELAHADLEAQRGQAVGELRVGAFATAARGLFPAALAALRGEHPQLRPMLREMEPEAALTVLARGDIDLAVVLDWYNRPLALPGGLSRRPLFDDVADVALPAGHPLADRAELDLDDLADENWVSWPPGAICHDWLMFTLRGRGIEPRVVHTAAEHHTQLALIAAGLGVAVAPRLGRTPVPDGVALIPVRGTITRRVYAVWREGSGGRPSIRAAVAALRAAAPAAEDAAPAPPDAAPRPPAVP